jgi:Dolichyl-phosphate-mannose-protein mannosyltransferase
MNKSQDHMHPNRLTWRDHVVSLVVFSLLTLCYLNAFLLDPAGFDGFGDDGLFANAFWWFRHALANLSNPFFSDYLFYPKGMSLVFHSDTYSNFLLTLPINYLWGVEVAVNMAYLLSFMLTGYCTYLLVHDLTGSRWGAFIAGVIFTFSPFHFGQGKGHLHISTLQWLPLYFLFLKQSLQGERVRQAICAGVVFGLIILTDQLQTICASLVTLVVILDGLRRVVRNREALLTGARQLAVIAVTAAGCAWFYLIPLLKELLGQHGATKVAPLEHGGANTFSADLLGFVIPGFHRLWGSAFASFNLGLDSSVYIGFITLALAGYGIWRCRREQPVVLALVVASLFWLMSLGTYLHVNGVWEFGSKRIPLPYLAMTDIPMLGDNRTPCRFHMITLLALSILAGYGVRELSRRFANFSSLRHGIVLSIIPVLIILETLSPRQEPGKIVVPPLYREMARDPEPYTILQLPLARWTALHKNGSGNPTIFMYYQTIHGKPIIGGFASRTPDEALDFNDEFLDLLVDTSAYDNGLQVGKSGPTAIELQKIREKGQQMSRFRAVFLKKYAIGAVVLQPQISGNSLSRALLESFLGTSLQDGGSGLAYAKIN